MGVTEAAKRSSALSPGAVRVLRYIRERRIPPTYREIMDACGISTTSLVAYYLDELEGAGYIERPGAPGSSRNIVVVE